MLNWSKAVLLTYGEDQPGGMSELDTVKCYHCGFTITVKPFTRPSTCKGCMQSICDVCEAKRELGDPCVPEEKRLEEFEKAVRKGMDGQKAFKLHWS